MQTQTNAPALPSATTSGELDLDAMEKAIRTSAGFAWCIIAGLPLAGIVATLCLALPLFAAMMAGCFLFATALVSHTAISTFTGRTLRLLVTARLMIILVLATLLFLTSGCVWVGVVSSVLLWLTADRILGRRALFDLWKLLK